MLSELGKVANKQMETSPYGKGELQEGHIQERPEIVDAPEKVADIPNEVSEISKKELEEGTKILQPDMEVIRTQSLEAVKQNNVERTQTSVKEENEFRELTEEEKQALREPPSHLSESAIQAIRVDTEGRYYLKCINEDLAGEYHEITGVKYVEKTITVDGVEITVVVPEFPCVFECNIPEELWKQGDRAIFKECTKQLKEYLELHPEMQTNFSEQQLEQIMKGEPYIRGYSWHHNEIPGKMQMVETKIHAPSNHTGGNHIWCGGIR